MTWSRFGKYRASTAGRPRVLITLLCVALLVAALLATAGDVGRDERRVTAVFDEAVNVHKGDEVRILGVPVGQVEDVEASADQVTVQMVYDDDYALAREATAAIVTPTLVSVRYIQLGPLADDGDDTLADDAVIPTGRTAAPLEWDDIKAEVSELTSVLGPRSGTQGSLRGLLRASARNLDGQGSSMRATLAELAGAFETLSTGRQDLFTVVRNLDTFVDALAANDAQVATFNHRLAQVSGILSSNRDDLATLLTTLDRSATLVARFVRANRGAIEDSVADLSSIVGNLALSRQALADVLQRTPTAASNLHNIYDPFSGALTTSAAITNFNHPAQFLCGIAMGAAPEGPDSTQARRYCETALDPLLDIARIPNAPVGLNSNVRDPDDTEGSR